MKFDVSEYQRAGLETNGCAGGAAITDFSQRRYRITQSIGLFKHLAVPVDGQLQFFRERIHYGYAHAMQPTRDFVGIAVELTPGVEYGHNDLSGRPSRLGVNVHRDAPPVVCYGYGTVAVHYDLYFRTITRQGLIHGIIDIFKNHVM